MIKTLTAAATFTLLMIGTGQSAGIALCADQAGQGAPATSSCASQTPYVVAQKRSMTLKVPAGKTYQVQIGERQGFQSFAAGTTVGGTDCVQVKCPSTFEDDVTCWKCKESLTSAN